MISDLFVIRFSNLPFQQKNNCKYKYTQYTTINLQYICKVGRIQEILYFWFLKFLSYSYTCRSECEIKNGMIRVNSPMFGLNYICNHDLNGSETFLQICAPLPLPPPPASTPPLLRHKIDPVLLYVEKIKSSRSLFAIPAGYSLWEAGLRPVSQ